VVFDVEVRIVDPVGLVQAQRHVQELAAQHRDQGQPAGQHLGQPGERQRRRGIPRVEQAQPADVAGRVGRLQGEEGRIKAGELLHRGPSRSAYPSPPLHRRRRPGDPGISRVP
jgi:hypothetical protein